VIALIGVANFAVFLSIAVYIFVLVQVLPPGGAWLASVIPFRGVYGTTVLFSTITYSQTLEVSGALSFLGLFFYAYGRSRPLLGRVRLFRSLGVAMVVFGVLVALVIYAEIHVLWGEFWYGIKFANLYPQGFPWGTEQVAYNTCFIRGNFTVDVTVNCSFLNYDELLYLSTLAALVGFYLLRRTGERVKVNLRLLEGRISALYLKFTSVIVQSIGEAA